MMSTEPYDRVRSEWEHVSIVASAEALADRPWHRCGAVELDAAAREHPACAGGGN